MVATEEGGKGKIKTAEHTRKYNTGCWGILKSVNNLSLENINRCDSKVSIEVTIGTRKEERQAYTCTCTIDWVQISRAYTSSFLLLCIIFKE